MQKTNCLLKNHNAAERGNNAVMINNDTEPQKAAETAQKDCGKVDVIDSDRVEIDVVCLERDDSGKTASGCAENVGTDSDTSGTVADVPEKKKKHVPPDKRRKSAKLKSAAVSLGIDPDSENASMLAFSVQLAQLGRVARDSGMDINVMRDCFYKYVELCAKYDQRVTHIAAYNAMGISKWVASSWATGKRRADAREYSELIQEVSGFCDVNTSQQMVAGKINPVTGIFWQKNFTGLRDVVTHEVDTSQAPSRTAEEIAEQYQDLIEE